MRSGVNEHAATATPPACDRRRGAPGGGVAAVAARLRSRGPRRRPLPTRAPVHDALVSVSVTSLRLGWWRLGRCPVGRHWSLVTLVRRSELTRDERRAAADARDIRLP